jgi:CRP-like cAMP-binding protein
MSTTALSIAEKLRAVETCPLFSGVPSADLAVLAEMMRTEYLRADEILFQAGEFSDSVYVVAAGTLNVFLPDESLPVRALSPGDLLGEYGLLANLARTATVRASTEAILLSLDYQRFRAFLLRFPEATLVMLKTAVARLVAAENKNRRGTSP